MAKRGRGAELLTFSAGVSGVVGQVRIKRGSLLQPGDPVCRVDGRSVLFAGEDDGVVVDVLVREHEAVAVGGGLFQFHPCAHHVVVHGLCTGCHHDLSKRVRSSVASPAPRDTFVRMQPSQPDMLFSRDKAAAVSSVAEDRLTKARKLSLVLDLDHTLLHATHDARHAAVLAEAPPEDVEELHEFELGPGRWRHLVKLRPGLRDFLERANEKFELHIFTHGTKEYGLEIARILDPTGALFAAQEGVGEKRITTLDDAYGSEERREKTVRGLSEYKRLDRLFPVSQRHVLVLDDNNVWGDCPNVVRVLPFVFFNPRLPREAVGEFAVGAGLPAPPKLPLNLLYFSESARETHLEEVWSVLDGVHRLFYSDVDAGGDGGDAAALFARVRGGILQGCKVCLSGAYAKDTPVSSQPLVTLLRDYGAQYCDEIEPGVTHVVGVVAGTSKGEQAQQQRMSELIGGFSVKQALAAGITVCHIDWLIDTIRRFRRMDERLYSQLPTERRDVGKFDKLLEEIARAYVDASPPTPPGAEAAEAELMELLRQEMDMAGEEEEEEEDDDEDD